jgi:pyruvate, water dikinase
MVEKKANIDKLLDSLQERAKELNCLYQIDALVNSNELSVEAIFSGIIDVIPPGWQYPEVCQVRIKYEDDHFTSEGFIETEWELSTVIMVHDMKVGKLSVFYSKEMPDEDEGPFLKEEKQLIHTIAVRLGHFLLHKHLQGVIENWEKARHDVADSQKRDWKIAVNLIKKTDLDLYIKLTRRMMNYLCWNGVHDADLILQKLGSDKKSDTSSISNGGNTPSQKKQQFTVLSLANEILALAEKSLPDDEILGCVHKWLQEDKSSFLIRTVINLESSLGDIADALRRFHKMTEEEVELAESTDKGTKVALIRRIISEQLNYINIAKEYVEIEDFHNLIPRMISPPNSHGHLGGKSAGLFLAARILEKVRDTTPELNNIKIPKTWYITSDSLHAFLHHNDLEEVTEQKYKDIEQVRLEYPHIVQLFKNSYFTPEIIQGLSMALDDFNENPLIVRSSSLLEDSLGAAFSGKYSSLFLANQGSKHERLEALKDAIAEVYSSTFSPDPIEYRAERGLLDFHEEMGIMIQEVVGEKVDKYFFPVYAGVAFSNNEFRWSSRIKREDGLIRLVFGLGTRAVDRLSDDYTILIAPGKPDMRVNASVDETIRYSPHKMDVINLETNNFETIDIRDFLVQNIKSLNHSKLIVSRVKDGIIRPVSKFNLDVENDELVANFEGLISTTSFTKQVKMILDTLEKELGEPVDIEFASDGENFYLLQCRPQSYSNNAVASPIPKDISKKSLLFSANKFVSNGRVPDITHIVYVDPDKYGQLETRDDMLSVGRVVGLLNKLLPKRQFILMGPGRWGSRGDIKLGVNVTYSDISNTAMLLEIARKKGNYIPDLSFGTHFFQDLVESSIRYLPLYPDDPEVTFNEFFLTHSKNILDDILPEYSYLNETIRVIDVAKITDGKILKVLMNAELDEAVGLLSQSSGKTDVSVGGQEIIYETHTEDHWRWRLIMCERIAEEMGKLDFGVEAFYVFGSAKNGTAAPGSDIDILLHFRGNETQRIELLQWLKGWSMCLDEINYQRTGYRSGELLDVHLIKDEDIENRNSYAVKIGAITDAAREVDMKRDE